MADFANPSLATLPTPRRSTCHRVALIDCAVLMVLSVAAEGAAFTARLGRATICSDSYQYVAAAEALLDPGDMPHFEMRKPGYPLFLAGVKLAFGQLGWVAIICNHALLLLLPLAAYGLGVHLHSRVLGWSAAILTMAQLQTLTFANWMMSETLYTFLLSFGLLVFVVGLRKPRAELWLETAGLLLGLAWLTRGVAAAVIPVALVAVAVVHRRNHRRAATLCAALAFPIVGIVVFECSLNFVFAGQFRTSNGTAGSCLWSHRMRVFQGADFPDNAEANQLRGLLPERSTDDAYTANYSDQWVALYRAVHDEGWEDWEFDDLCRRTAWASIRTAPGAFASYSLKLSVWHLLRRGDGIRLSPVPESRRRGLVLHPFAPNTDEDAGYWNAYWSVPHLAREESTQLIDRMKAAAAQRAPFAGTGVWSALRYWKTKPVVVTSLNALTWLADLWPGFALLLCGFVGLNRVTCCVLAAAYVAEAMLLGTMTITNTRYQTVWVVTDTTLAAALPTVVLAGLASRAWARVRSMRDQQR